MDWVSGFVEIKGLVFPEKLHVEYQTSWSSLRAYAWWVAKDHCFWRGIYDIQISRLEQENIDGILFIKGKLYAPRKG